MNQRHITKAMLAILPLAFSSTLASAEVAPNTLPGSKELAALLQNVPAGGHSYKYTGGISGAPFNVTPSALSPGWYGVHCWNLQNYWNGTTSYTIAYTVEGLVWLWAVNSILASSMEPVMIDVCQRGSYAFFHVFDNSGNWDEIQIK
ncbi:hypothetical protein [Methylocystis heyeri]|uniref:Uncharacterized protein n=1 Tax=Methylocystis heyeri TaxID=391905 RepID=A0A6B8K8L3_9HYPH|nr:hypothetical protein [Methylocystis heyeri]QGM44356.1 hypothetical protein H2LOC_000820 [Methylocystis heyeri]